MAKVTIKDLLEAGVHFGHQTKRWNPKMKPFVFGSKNGISIIDLTKTMRQMADACNFLQKVVTDGGQILFVGTKRQAQQLVAEAAEKTDMYHVTERWLGGTLTNNVTIRKSIDRMTEIDELLGSNDVGGLKKKEISRLNRQTTKLHRDLDGIRDMKKLPAALVIVDVCKEDIAVREANKLNIPIVAIVDTNGDPDSIDFPIPANDDAVKSLKIIIDVFSDAIQVASEIYSKRVIEEKAKAEAEKKAKEAEEKAKAEKAKAEKAEKKPAKKAPAKKAEKEDKEEKPAKEEKVEEKEAPKKKAPAKKAAPKKAEKEDKEEKPAKEEKAEEKLEEAKAE